MSGPSETRRAEPQPLPLDLPAEPWSLFEAWLEDAQKRAAGPNPLAMTLASVTRDGRPSARQVICRGLDLAQGWLVFYTDRRSRKGRELEANPYAALVFHWDLLQRQVRIEGPVTPQPESDSDAYFAGRPRDAQISAWASTQSEPIDSRDALLEQVARAEQRFATSGTDSGALAPASLPRPPYWVGYRVWVERLELWVGLPGRAHDRGLWTRRLERAEGDDPSFVGGAWQVTRLQP